NDILSRDISSSTHYEDGKRAGIKIESVKADSIAAQHGMQQGDIIKSINGYPVNSKQEAISFAKKNADRYKIWQIEVENMGRVRTEVYHSPEK
ncbi:MAG: PDZ domain-containing protein, partial [Planctomycetota bacterium]